MTPRFELRSRSGAAPLGGAVVRINEAEVLRRFLLKTDLARPALLRKWPFPCRADVFDCAREVCTKRRR